MTPGGIPSAGVLVAAFAIAGAAEAQEWRSALKGLDPLPERSTEDWLITRPTRRAGVFRVDDRRLLVLDNGLIRREFLLEPNLACVGFTQLTTGEVLRPSTKADFGIRIDGSGGCTSVAGCGGRSLLTISFVDNRFQESSRCSLIRRWCDSGGGSVGGGKVTSRRPVQVMSRWGVQEFQA